MTSDRVANFKRFYTRCNDRPLLGFWLGSEYPCLRYQAARNLPEDRPLEPEDSPVEAYPADCERLFEEHERCGGDFIWSGGAFWGIPWGRACD